MLSVSEKMADSIQVLDEVKKSAKNLNCAMPGVIEMFDAETQTASVRITIRRAMQDGSTQEYPLIMDAPVLMLGGGEYSLTFPVKAGDECLVIFADTCIDAWYQSGGVQEQATRRSHDISDGFVIVGFRSKPNALRGFNEQIPNITSLLVDGKKVLLSQKTLYASSNGRDTAPTDGWTQEMPKGGVLWQKAVSLYSDGSVEESPPVCLQGADGRDGESATVVRVDSSRGVVFKNNAVSTVLSAVVYHGSNRITDIEGLKSVFGSAAHIEWSWQRMGEETFGVILSSDSRIGQDGFTLTISPDDVDVKTVFMCSLKD